MRNHITGDQIINGGTHRFNEKLERFKQTFLDHHMR